MMLRRLRKRGLSLVLVLAAGLATGCVYSRVAIPLDRNLDETSLGQKVGRAQIQSVLWLVAWGDAGTQAAARQGGIEILRQADTEIYSLLFGLYYRQTTVVYGD